MPTLGELARALGGVIRDTDGHDWLDTRVGALRAAVIRRHAPLTHTVTYDIAVYTSDADEVVPFPASGSDWSLDGSEGVLPVLPHGFVFAGHCGGVLLARSQSSPSLEQIVGALWELAEWARTPWTESTTDEPDSSVLARRRRWRRVLVRVAVVALVVVVAMLVRRAPR